MFLKIYYYKLLDSIRDMKAIVFHGKARATCIFCQSVLQEKTSPEHIINNSIGGTLASKRIVCTPCNSKLSIEIDNFLAKKYSILMNILSPCLKKTGPQLQTVLKQSGKTSKILPGMVPAPMIKVIKKKEGGNIIWAPEERIEEILKGLKYREIISRENVVQTQDDTQLLRLPVFSVNECRVIVKTCLEYIAHKFPKESIGVYNKALAFVTDGDILDITIASLNTDTFRIAKDFDRHILRTKFCHRIIISFAPPTVEAAVILFDKIGYKVNLSDAYNGKSFSLLYQKNILKGVGADSEKVVDEKMHCGDCSPFEVAFQKAAESLDSLHKDACWHIDTDSQESVLESYRVNLISGKSNGETFTITGGDLIDAVWGRLNRVFFDKKEEKDKRDESNKIKVEFGARYGGIAFSEKVPDLTAELRSLLWEIHLFAFNKHKQYVSDAIYGFRSYGLSIEKKASP